MIEKDNGHGLKFKSGGENLMRRVAGWHDLRLDGIADILSRAKGASVFDIGCSRGLTSFEFTNNGATRVMGCDIYEDGIICARHIHCDMRNVYNRFEVVDLTGGEKAIKAAFGDDAKLEHDITVMLATYHKLKRIMAPEKLGDLVKYFGLRTKKYFCWRGYDDELVALDNCLGAAGLKRVQTSTLSDIQPAAIWARKT